MEKEERAVTRAAHQGRLGCDFSILKVIHYRSMTTDYVIIMHQRTNSRPARQALPKLECNVAESQRLIKRSSLKPPSLVYVCRNSDSPFSILSRGVVHVAACDFSPLGRPTPARCSRCLSTSVVSPGTCRNTRYTNLPEYQIYSTSDFFQ